ncbi:hypothetical protein [uncultured Modestobacter sp.]|uniref:hypothetical protein n=1 Tax=uncultured Modestobacter sp. TaxID=380048 RepID=UPI00262A120F|nr:hypothetical protein [uncultured Modestobacter sp.]
MLSTRRAAMTVAATVAVLAVAPPASAAEETGPSTVGYDVSYPQCGTELPDDAAYAVIGVNGGIATTENPCLADQWEWAHGSSGAVSAQPVAQLYVNTANPGEVRAQVSTWPRTGVNRYGVCDGGNTAACSYEYGVDRAEDDVRMVLDILGDLPGDAAVTEADLEGLRWWLDVETMNTWQTDGVQARRNNRATLEGMADHLTSVGGWVGLYSTGYQWGEIVGDVPRWSSLYELDSWLAGAQSWAGAVHNCRDEPLVEGGQVVLSQYVVDDLDHDHSCALPQDDGAAPWTPGAPR